MTKKKSIISSFSLVVWPLPPPPHSGRTTSEGTFFAASLTALVFFRENLANTVMNKCLEEIKNIIKRHHQDSSLVEVKQAL